MWEFQTQRTGKHWPRSLWTSPQPHSAVATGLCTPDQARWTENLSAAEQRNRKDGTIWAQCCQQPLVDNQIKHLQGSLNPKPTVQEITRLPGPVPIPLTSAGFSSGAKKQKDKPVIFLQVLIGFRLISGR